jgi:phosphate transport system substrate-binding protein
VYFVSNGKPTNPVTVAFLNWILTDGQKFVSEAGYVMLTEDKVVHEMGKLNQ